MNEGDISDCTTIRRLILEEDARSLAPEQARAIETHLAGCAGCRREAELLGGTWRFLDEVKDLDPSPVFVARALAALETAGRQDGESPFALRATGDKSVNRRTGAPVLRLWIPAALGAAAAALLVLGIEWRTLPETPARRTSSTASLAPQDEEVVAQLDLLENMEIAEKMDVLETKGRLPEIERLLDSQEGVR